MIAERQQMSGKSLGNSGSYNSMSLQTSTRANIVRLEEILKANRTCMKFDPEIERSSLL